jgi:glycosyltransferase involved in cell wall biosynthesis
MIQNSLIPKEKTIHYCLSGVGCGGGVDTYVKSLLQAQPPHVSPQVITWLKNIDQSQFKLLHVQEQQLVWDITGECPTVYTLHNHSPYCPSGSKYLTMSGTSCDRVMSTLGCTWGHLIDGCGSRRPENIVQNFQKSYRELDTLKKLRIPVIANSDYVRGQLIKHGLPPEQAVTLHCAISIPKTITEPLTLETHQNSRLLFAGRIVPEKGLDWLLKALTQVDRRVHLDVAGEGWIQPQMERLAKKLGVSDRVTWHGWCDREKMDTLYRQCYALVFPSLWHEPAGLVTLEAYAHHRPVIASSLGGIPEYIRDRKTGILVPANDLKKLAAAIDELAENYQKARSLGEEGYAMLLEKFTIDTQVKQLQVIYEKTIDDFQYSKKNI